MRWHLSAFAAPLAAMFTADLALPARAETYPVCLFGGYDSSASHCDFSNLEQCRATASGIGGSCGPNPAYTAAPAVIRGGPAMRRR